MTITFLDEVDDLDDLDEDYFVDYYPLECTCDETEDSHVTCEVHGLFNLTALRPL